MDFCITSREIISLKETMERTRLGTSMPTAWRPGMGATMRTLGAASRRAMLSERLAIFETRTPCAGRTSKSVMTGPLRMPGHLGVDVELFQGIGEDPGGALGLIVDQPVLVVGPVLQHLVDRDPVRLRTPPDLGNGSSSCAGRE